jgi:hypothetical protein
MNYERSGTAITLLKAVAVLQVKLLLGAARDLALVPLALAAAVIDLLLLKWREPEFFRDVLRLGEHSDVWIDVWSFGRGAHATPRENVDALIARVEEVVRDPQTGARRARVLKRWAERQLARARQRATNQMSTERDRTTPGDTSDMRRGKEGTDSARNG